MAFTKPKTPAEQVFAAQWDNYMTRMFYKDNEELAWELFQSVWNLAVEEALNVSQPISMDAATAIGKLLTK